MSAALSPDQDSVIREAIQDAINEGVLKAEEATCAESVAAILVAHFAIAVDSALARYEEAKRWRAEAQASVNRAVHDFGVALVKEEQARVRYLEALDAQEAG